MRRFERGELASLDVAEVGAWCAVVGLDLAIRAFPGGDAIRDAGQQRLIGRLEGRLHPQLVWRTEVPLGIEGDLRAWDATIVGRAWTIAVEAETVLDDLQAVERRIALKANDAGSSHLLLVLADTRRNRRALAAAPGSFGGYSRDARRILRCLGGRSIEPPQRGLLFL